MKKSRVLLSCYACEPDKGSEPGVGWNWALAMSEKFKVRVLTRSNNQNAIRQALLDIQKPNLSFLYYDLPQWVLNLKKKGLISTSAYYILWQLGAKRMMGKSIDDFDIVHHMTFNMFLSPGFWRPEKAKLILGPLGGGSCVSVDYLALFGGKKLIQKLRSKLVGSWKYIPTLRNTFDRADYILCANEDTYKLLGERYRNKCHVHLETGIQRSKIREPEQQAGNKVRFIQIGNIEARKGWRLTLNAVANICGKNGQHNFECWFVGDGPELKDAKLLARELGIESVVFFYGKLPLHKTHQMLGDADVLLFPSVRDTSGNVVLEAMSMAKPIICFCHQGAREMTDERCAFRLKPSPIDQSINLIAEAMETLIEDDELRRSMGAQGVQRISAMHTWDAKREFMEDLYWKLLNNDKRESGEHH